MFARTVHKSESKLTEMLQQKTECFLIINFMHNFIAKLIFNIYVHSLKHLIQLFLDCSFQIMKFSAQNSSSYWLNSTQTI